MALPAPVSDRLAPYPGLLLAHIPDVVLLQAADGRILDVNRAAIEVLGYSREELVGQTPGLFDVKWKELRRAAVCRPLANGEVARFDTVHRRKDGTTIPVEVQISWLTESNQSLAVSVSRDITRRKQAETELKNQAARFEEIARLSPGVLHSWRRDPSGRAALTYMSPRMGELLGLESQDLIRFGEDPSLLTHPDDLMHVRTAVIESERTLSPCHCEYRLRHPTRGYIWVECHTTPVREADGSVVWHGFLTDVTERRRAQDALRESEARLAEAQHIGGFGSFEFDVRSRRFQVSEVLGELLGLGAGPLPPAELSDIEERILPEDRVRVEAEWRSGPDRVASEFQARYRHPDGRERLFHVRWQAVVGEDGARAKVLGTVQDISERRRLDERLRHSQKMEAIGQLAGGIAHDFNNILTVINGYAAMGAEYLAADDPQLEIFSEIMRAGSRASALTRQLLTFSRKQLIKPQVVYVGTLVGDLANMLRRVIGDHIELVVTVAAGDSPVLIDPAQFQQVLLNLAVNGRDAMPQGGRLSIDVRHVTLDDRYCAAHPGVAPGNYVRLMVADTGRGMDEATRLRVCEPFFTTKQPGEGTGLGLAVVHGAVGQSGGHLDIRSEVGAGTSVMVYLPVTHEATACSLGTAVQAVRPRGTETVLIVDDDDGVRALSQRVLRTAGYKVLIARNGEDALRVERRQAGDVHLLVTDVVMPRMGGRELANQLLGRRPSLKVLFMSGYAPETVEYHGVLEESENFLPKPFGPSDLARKVREVLERQPVSAVPGVSEVRCQPLGKSARATAHERPVPRRRRTVPGKPTA